MIMHIRWRKHYIIGSSRNSKLVYPLARGTPQQMKWDLTQNGLSSLARGTPRTAFALPVIGGVYPLARGTHALPCLEFLE
ncbi:hypothetical protein KCP70_06015 [Salmonella enterica subsp. enterica]|nr:hypothetical protein KCP70_06015 [Salmonella enterica subsp. enterica]